MNKNPLISVVVPMYNAEKFIEKCLMHLICQTYQNLEIILVDDGSKDGTVKLCEKYAKTDKRIKIVKQKNAGPSVASNTGMDAASGEWIHFHDHDDFVNLDYFEKMANAAVLTNADILCGEVNQPEYSFPVFDKIEICFVNRFVIAAGAVVIAHIDHIFVAQTVIPAVLVQRVIFIVRLGRHIKRRGASNEHDVFRKYLAHLVIYFAAL